MFRFKHLLKYPKQIFLYGSTVAFWYTQMPSHWQLFSALMVFTYVSLSIVFYIMARSFCWLIDDKEYTNSNRG